MEDSAPSCAAGWDKTRASSGEAGEVGQARFAAFRGSPADSIFSMIRPAQPAFAIKRMQFLCSHCRLIKKNFGDPEEAPSFENWIAAVRGHIITFHGALKKGETENRFLRAVYL
jgi:hypothetical protein